MAAAQKYTVDDLQRIAEFACQEMAYITSLHEHWKPAAYDETIFSRFNNTYAGHSFNVIRVALRREVVLGLLRLWDSKPRTFNMRLISENLRDDGLYDCVLSHIRDAFMPSPDCRAEYRAKRTRLCDLITDTQGESSNKWKCLFKIRNEHLAHRNTGGQPKLVAVASGDKEDTAVEWLYNRSAKIVEDLLAVTNGHTYSFSVAAGVDNLYAGYFWDAFRPHGPPSFE